jgi:hypothetical protein
MALMTPHQLLRAIVINRHTDERLCYALLKSGANPFYEEEGRTTFEIAAENNNEQFVKIFVMVWLLRPNWLLHDEVYKLEMNKKMLTLINTMLLPFHNKHMLVSHVLNILYLYLMY